MRYENNDAVIRRLKSIAKLEHARNWKAYSQLRKYSGRVTWKDKSYRLIAGIFKVRAGYFTNYSGTYWFDPVRQEATSYSWWSMLTTLNGKLVRNVCGYSRQTSKHQHQLTTQLSVLGIKPDLVVCTRANISDRFRWKVTELATYGELCVLLKYSTKKTKRYRRLELYRFEKYLQSIEATKIGIKFSKADKIDAFATVDAERTLRLERGRIQREQIKQRQIEELNNDSRKIASL